MSRERLRMAYSSSVGLVMAYLKRVNIQLYNSSERQQLLPYSNNVPIGKKDSTQVLLLISSNIIIALRVSMIMIMV
jgi:hypothetical protein